MARRGAALCGEAQRCKAEHGGAGRDVAWRRGVAWRGVWCCRGTNKEQVVGTERGVGSAPTNKGGSGVAYGFWRGLVWGGVVLCCVVLWCDVVLCCVVLCCGVLLLPLMLLVLLLLLPLLLLLLLLLIWFLLLCCCCGC